MEKLEGEIGDYKISHKRKDDKNTNHATIREDIKQIGIRLDPNHLGLENLVLPLKELKEVLGNDLYERYISYIEILRSKAFQLANLHNLEELESMDIFPNRDPESRLTNRFRLDNHIRLTVESLASLDNLRNKGELTFILNDLDIKEDQIAISKICEILQIDSQKFMKTLKENSKVKIGIFNTKEYGVGIRIGDYENRI